MVNRHTEQLEAIGITPAEYLSELKAVGQELQAKETQTLTESAQVPATMTVGMERETTGLKESALTAQDLAVGDGQKLTAGNTVLETIYTERMEELKAEAGKLNDGQSMELTQGISLDTERPHELQHQQDHELAI